MSESGKLCTPLFGGCGRGAVPIVPPIARLVPLALVRRRWLASTFASSRRPSLDWRFATDAARSAKIELSTWHEAPPSPPRFPLRSYYLSLGANSDRQRNQLKLVANISLLPLFPNLAVGVVAPNKQTSRESIGCRRIASQSSAPY